MPNNEVLRVGGYFDICTPLSKEKARQLAVELVEDFVNEVNQNERLKPYLTESPFTDKHIYVAILS